MATMAFAVACFCCSVLAADAGATYYVGDGNGWSFGSPSWPNGKHFHAGDTLGTPSHPPPSLLLPPMPGLAVSWH